MKVIVFDNSVGVSVIQPTEEALREITLEEIANRDVPFGTSWAIIDSSKLPSAELRDFWEFDEKKKIVIVNKEKLDDAKKENELKAYTKWKEDASQKIKIDLGDGRIILASREDRAVIVETLFIRSLCKEFPKAKEELPPGLTLDETFWLMEDGTMQKVTAEELAIALTRSAVVNLGILREYSNTLLGKTDA